MNDDGQAVLFLEGPPDEPPRKKLPEYRLGTTIKFKFGDEDFVIKGYLTQNSYPNGDLGEIFVNADQVGDFANGIMDALCIAVSIGLQHGIPLETYVKKFVATRFAPMGITGDPEVPICKSVLDYIFRKLAHRHMTKEQLEAANIDGEPVLQVSIPATSVEAANKETA